MSKILVVHPAMIGGGLTRIAIDDALMLRRQGFEVAFAGEGGPLEDELRAVHIPLHRMCFVDPSRYPQWVRYLLGIPITTVILLYLVWRYKYNYLYVQHRQSGIPSMVVHWLTGAKYVFHAQGEFGKLNRGRLLTPLGRHVIACSEQVKMNIFTYFHVPTQRVSVIPNGSNTDVVNAEESSLRAFDEKWSIPSGAEVVACVAMLVEIKAHDILLMAWEKVLRHFPRTVLVLTGTGPLKERLQTQCVQLGIDQSVRFLGFVDDVAIVYSRASFVVLSSRSEGLPRGILDGFPYGLPAVATAVSGTPEIVLPGKTGLLVEPDNPEQLAQAIMRLLSDPQLRQELGQAARQLAVEKYSAAARELALADYFRALVKT